MVKSLFSDGITDLLADASPSSGSRIAQTNFDDWGYFGSFSDDVSQNLQGGLAATAQQRKGTIMSKIAPNLQTSVSATSIQSCSFTAAKTAGVKTVSENKTKLAGVGSAVQNTKNAMATAVQAAKLEVVAVLKEMGSEYAGLFRDTRVAGSAVGLVANAALGGGASMTSFLDLLYSEKGKTKKSQNAMVAEVLTKMQERPKPAFGGPSAGLGGVMATALAPTGQSAVDFSDIDSDELKAIMYADPDNLNEEMFPEIKGLNAMAHIVDREMDNIDLAEAKLCNQGLSFSEQFASVSLDVRGDVASEATAVDGAVKEMLLTLHNEPPQRITAKLDLGIKTALSA